MADKVALISGVTGQDGAYLSELLLSKGYHVHGIKRRSSSFNTERVDHLYEDPHEKHPRFLMHYGELTDATNLIRLVQEVQPDEIYNLAAQSHVAVSFETPEYTANADAIGTLRLTQDDLRAWAESQGIALGTGAGARGEGGMGGGAGQALSPEEQATRQAENSGGGAGGGGLSTALLEEVILFLETL